MDIDNFPSMACTTYYDPQKEDNGNINFIEDIEYEISMLISTYKHWKHKIINSPNNIPTFYRNLIWEAMLVHLRVLTEFFFYNEKSRHDDDIVYKRYIPNNSDLNEKILSYNYKTDIEPLKDVIHKFLAHLTTKRQEWTSDYKISNINNLIKIIFPLLLIFLKDNYWVRNSEQYKKFNENRILYIRSFEDEIKLLNNNS